MKVAVIFYHKNVGSYCPVEWVMKCVKSLKDQTYKNFDVFELNYGEDDKSYYPLSLFEHIEMPTHAHAQNYLLDKIFAQDYDCAFNVNADDYYTPDRFEKQLPYITEGYDLISSNYKIFYPDGRMKDIVFAGRDIATELSHDHNIMAHPVVCYSRKFWLKCGGYIPEDIPCEDMRLWQRSIKRGLKLIIIPHMLLYYRIHENNVSGVRRKK